MRFNVYDNVQILAGCSIDPQSDSTTAVAVNGNKVDTLGGDNAALYARCAAATGSPAGFTVAFKVQESADGSTSWSDALDNTGTAIGFTLDCHAAAAENLARIEGLGSLNRKRIPSGGCYSDHYRRQLACNGLCSGDHHRQCPATGDRHDYVEHLVRVFAPAALR